MSFTSADLLDALRRRMRKSLRPQRPTGEFPPGWATWFDSMREHVGRVTGATEAAIVAIFLAREPKLPPRAEGELNRWQSFTTIWRQQWQPASEDERSLRIVAIVVTLLAHLLLAVFLLYVAYVRVMGIPEPAREGEDVIQVEYIGDGTPEDEGGGAAQGEVNPQVQPAAAAAAASTAPVPQVAQQPSPPQSAAPAEPESASAAPAQPSPAPPIEQPLQVTETPVPAQPFTVPPLRAVEIPQPVVRMPDLGATAAEVKVVDVSAPLPHPSTREVTPRPMTVPQLQQRPAEVVVREVAAPMAPVQLRNLPSTPVSTPQLQARAPTVAARHIPGPPAASPQSSTVAASQPANGSSRSASAEPAGGAKTASTGSHAASPAAGAGKTVSPRPGALPSPRRGDDWGASNRNRPGGQAGKPGGLFNADGTPRLGSGDGKVGGGLPPGTITEDFAKIDRNGTWLKRPPTDYTPTSFDKFWVPNEDLLQEWVRRSIKEVLIPIPGTSKTIKCSIVLLALGGACGISDPNMQDVEATARKPPEIPFKPELQEDQDSLAKPATP